MPKYYSTACWQSTSINTQLTFKRNNSNQLYKIICSISQKKPDLCVLMTLKLQQYKYGTNDLQKSLATYIFL